MLSFKLGLRTKELASLKVGDVYQNGKLLYLLSLSKEQKKGEKQRELSLSNKQVAFPRLFNSDFPFFIHL